MGQDARWSTASGGRQLAEQAAFLHVRRAGAGVDERLWRLERDIRACVAQSGAGELSAVELTEEEWIGFAYGPSADRLLRALEAVLAYWDLPTGSYVSWRRGGLEAPEERRELSGPTRSVAGRGVRTMKMRPDRERER